MTETLLLACTDRGRHPERTVAAVWDDHGLRGSATVTRPGRMALDDAWKEADGLGLAMAPCPTCGRDVRLSADRVRTLWDSGLRRADVSLLP